MITRIIFTASLLLTIAGWGYCQPTTSNLAVRKYPSSSFNARYLRLQKTREDTARVNLLLEISSICHRKQTLESPDSSIMFARQAVALSKRLRYTDGYCEAIFLITKSHLRKDDLPAAERMLNEASGELYVRLLLVLSEYCMDKGGPGSDKMQKAARYLTLANRMSANLKSRHWMTESGIALGKYHFRMGQMTLGSSRFYEVINYHRRIHDKAGEAHWWQELGRYIPDTDSTYAIEINSLQRARALYKQLGDVKAQAECLDNEAYIHLAHGKTDLAERRGIEELGILKTAGLDHKLPSCYQRLSKTMLKKKNNDKALEYALLGMESVKALKDSNQLMRTYELIGDLQRTIGNPAESARYYKLALSTITQSPDLAHNLLKRLTEVQLGMNRPADALASIQWLIKWRGGPQTNSDKQLFALMMANCYAQMGQLAAAERHFAEVARLNEEIQSTPVYHWYTFTNVVGAEAYLAVAQFYARLKRYDKSNRYLAAALRSANLTPDIERESRYLRYKNDSIAGILPASTVDFQRYVSLKDSIDRVTKGEQLELLKANFKSAQREKDIQLLKNEALLRERQLQLSAQKEKLTYAGIFTLFCLLGLTYNSFRIKQNKNRQLEAQQDIINKKNVALLKLIDEKELLMKEVHHRVKNNLQTVTSLLTSQSFHLRDQGAVKAIDDSRNRIEAISMLHQRIYQSGNMVGVALKSYVAEMICNLEECFDTVGRIRFSIAVEDMILDLSQTVPVGLILNEAITNSLKYAFPHGRKGNIEVSLVKIGHDRLSLSVSDNGTGLPADFDIASSPTFGFQLIKGLTADLNGQLTIRIESGTKLRIDFDQVLSPNV
ncbi:Two-component sensor histidine kinase, contains HisKA and HATPase domains [Dyadobacter soli]|uniref:histidine kinase n=1 Tax=Dyadobacter soli TaxID=659014 RepID=A0A1G7S780_9BACT|nr:histidine kinase dimerization/phosphoacceptor domain -containing protein [Dyadobacter soli]SDG18887.1 Two-component sensor histidine kinase, contains HisKA and HATPase domains [Dyadobacter soli]